MAIIRNTTDSGNLTNYGASIAFYLCVSCLVLVLKFKGFKARINISSSKNKSEIAAPQVSISGAYRVKREEIYGSGSLPDPPKKITPSMVKLPTSNNATSAVRPAMSTGDLTRPEHMQAVTASRSNLEISFDPRGGPNSIPNVERRQPEKGVKERKKEERGQKEEKARKKEEKNQKEEEKKLAKKRLAEQKAREKAAQEQAKQQAKREKEQAPQVKARVKKDKKDKTAAPAVPASQVPPAAPAAQTSAAPAPPTRRQVVSTISIQSDINRSSGPPPYTELPVQNEKDGTGNTSFSKPLDNSSSWDMISQHRQQINRPTATVGATGRKQMVMDLQYKYGNDKENDRDNSEA